MNGSQVGNTNLTRSDEGSIDIHHTEGLDGATPDSKHLLKGGRTTVGGLKRTHINHLKGGRVVTHHVGRIVVVIEGGDINAIGMHVGGIHWGSSQINNKGVAGLGVTDSSSVTHKNFIGGYRIDHFAWYYLGRI